MDAILSEMERYLSWVYATYRVSAHVYDEDGHIHIISLKNEGTIVGGGAIALHGLGFIADRHKIALRLWTAPQRLMRHYYECGFRIIPAPSGDVYGPYYMERAAR